MSNLTTKKGVPGDTFKRRETSPGKYQCGCTWIRTPEFGDQLVECPFHHSVTIAKVEQFERKHRERK